MPNVELDDEFLNLFYNITNSKPPKNIELLDLKKQLINIVDTLKELNDEIKTNATVINGVITKINKMETTFTEQINNKANSTELATLQSKVAELEQRIATLESNQAA